MEQISLEDLDEVESLLIELKISLDAGNLILCTVSSPAYRDRIIQLLRSRFSLKLFQIEGGDQLIRILKNPSVNKANRNSAKILVWMLPEKLGMDLLEALNNFREIFYQVGVPSVIFLSAAALNDVVTQAPDFWRYRGGFHELIEGEHNQAFQALETLATKLDLSYRNKDELLRRKRINEYLLDKIKNREEKSKILNELSIIHFLLAEYPKSVEISEQALAISREIRDRRGEGDALGNLGNAYSTLGETRKAIEYHDQALAISQEFRDRMSEGNVLNNLGIAYYILGEIRKAIEYYEQALAISREIGDKRGEGNALGNLGNAYSTLGETRKAIEYHDQALAISRDIGDRRGEENRLGNLGNAYYFLGEIRKAIEYYEQALAISREIGDKRGEGNALGNLGLTLDKLGKRDQAIKFTEDALKIFEQIESPNAKEVRRQLAELEGEVE